jgi:hypothetical protein
VKDAFDDFEQIRAWWALWPDANVGIATGADSGLVIFVIDPRQGGEESYAKLQQELPSDTFAQLLKVRTGSGGSYLYFQHPGGYVQSQANIRPGIDIKADDSYVVAPSSRDVNGRVYCFASNSGLVCPPLPAALHDLICKEAQARVHSKPSSSPKPEPAFTASVDPGAGSSTSHPRPGSGRVLSSRRASEIQAEAIHWLWDQRIALGKLSLIAGEPGLGKSQVTTDIAAKVSSGGAWCTGEKCGPGDVLIFSAEDDASDTIRPRLEACGADLTRVHIIESVHHITGKRDQFFTLKQDLDVLGEKLLASPEVRLVIIDPISAYLGRVNSHNNAEVRGVLAPLAQLAAKYRVAVVCVTHLNKGSANHPASGGVNPLARVIDSTAFGATVLTAFLIAKDPAAPDRRFFLPLKTNISSTCAGLAFHIEPHVLACGIKASRVSWDNRPVTITAQEALSGPAQDEIDTAKETAEACVRVFDKEQASEMRSSGLIKSLAFHENIFLDGKAPIKRGGPGCLNRFSASISGASARVRLPSGVAAG